MAASGFGEYREWPADLLILSSIGWTCLPPATRFCDKFRDVIVSSKAPRYVRAHIVLGE